MYQKSIAFLLKVRYNLYQDNRWSKLIQKEKTTCVRFTGMPELVQKNRS